VIGPALPRRELDTDPVTRHKRRAVAASYFDVDGTLVRTSLIEPTLWYLMHQRSPLRSLQKLARAAFRSPQMVWAEMQDRRLFNEALFTSYEGISQDRLLYLADDAFESVLKKAIYPHAKDLVTRCRDEGQDVVIVSGALDFLMKRLADHLGATSVIANRLEIKDGFATGRLLRPVVAGPEKARLVREHAREHGHDLDECFAYSDSYSDVPMLSVVGHPAAVNPDGKLQRLARTYGWPILSLDNAVS
jgi:HAD superfamily hydrolase (TIGR01490 family)